MKIKRKRSESGNHINRLVRTFNWKVLAYLKLNGWHWKRNFWNWILKSIFFGEHISFEDFGLSTSRNPLQLSEGIMQGEYIQRTCFELTGLFQLVLFVFTTRKSSSFFVPLSTVIWENISKRHDPIIWTLIFTICCSACDSQSNSYLENVAIRPMENFKLNWMT